MSESPQVVQPEGLEAALRAIDIEVPPETAGRLADYATRLWQWNAHINLTRHTDVETFVRRDVWDSWHLAECLAEGEEVLDIGSGGGIPGIVLAILRPDLQMTLCDSVAKKARVLDDLVAGLELPIAVYAARAEELVDDFRFDSLVARAVGPLPKLTYWFRDKWNLFGRLLAIKGPNWPAERGEARHRGLMTGVRLRRLKEYPMLGTSSQSTILELRREG